MSFSEVRAYQYGDDVRNIDWNVTARSGEAHIKIFEEEREMSVMLLIDMSRSAFFGSTDLMKQEVLTEICAVLAFSAINNNDKVGVIFFSDKIEKFIPPQKGKKHILLIIRELINFEPIGKGTNMTAALKYFNSIAKKRTVTFIISDFLAKHYEDALRVASRRHDIIGIHLHDLREQMLPNIGLVRARDSEANATMWLDTSDPKVRADYAAHYTDNYDYFKNTFKKVQCDVLSIDTAVDYIGVLLRFFKHRN